ncbi:V-type proton ATPase subunit G 2-like [Dysidea avara]|uniref:V-type proton ATPase subunit G 2-like n=1 Tax=Dysidea avara TaxID=196820 RepID=UPI00331E2C57
MASQSEGIRKLMQAERQAEEVVSSAKRKKAQRIKEAKEEAKKEVETYKQEREHLFQEQMKKNAGSKDDFAAKMRVDTEKRLQKITSQVSTSKEMVIDRLLELVCDIKPEVHQNYRPKVQ